MNSLLVKITGSVGAAMAALCLITEVQAQNTWDGGGANNNWTTNANWNADALPANDGTANIIFAGSTRLSPVVDTAQNVLRIGFDTGAGSFNISGATLTLQSTNSAESLAIISNRSSVLQTISANISMPGGGNTYIYATNGDLVLSGNLATNTRRLILGNAGSPTHNITMSGNITGSGFSGNSLLLNTDFLGVVTLSGSNSYSGASEIRNGTLRVGSNNALGSSTADVTVGAATGTPLLLVGGAYTVSKNVLVTGATAQAITLGGDTANTSVFSGTVKLGSTAGKPVTLTAASSGTVRFTGNLVTSASGVDDLDAVTKTGAGTVVLEGTANTYSGSTRVTAGTLLINGSYTVSGQPIAVSTSATLGGSGSINRAVTISTGAVLIAGDGISNTSMLTLGNNLTMGDGSTIKLTLGNGGIHSVLARTGGTWAFDSNQSFTLNGTSTPFGNYLGIITGLTGSEAGLASIATWTVDNPLYAGSVFSFDGSNVNLNLVPEPSTCLLAGLGLVLALGRRARRQV